MLPLRTQGHEACEKSVRLMQLRAICVGCLSIRNKRASRKSTSPPGRETAMPLVMVALCVICALATRYKYAQMPRGPSSAGSFASKAPCKSSTLLAGVPRLRSRMGLLPARPRLWTCSGRRLTLAACYNISSAASSAGQPGNARVVWTSLSRMGRPQASPCRPASL